MLISDCGTARLPRHVNGCMIAVQCGRKTRSAKYAIVRIRSDPEYREKASTRKSSGGAGIFSALSQ